MYSLTAWIRRAIKYQEIYYNSLLFKLFFIYLNLMKHDRNKVHNMKYHFSLDVEHWVTRVVADILGQASRLYSWKQNYTTYYLNPKHLTGPTSLSLHHNWLDHWMLSRSKMTKSRKREFVIYTSSDLRVDVNGRWWFFFEVFRLVLGVESALQGGSYLSRQYTPVDQDKGRH